MTVLSWQQKLNAAGYHLRSDGIAGPITYAALFDYMGEHDPAIGLAAALHFPVYDITTDLRVAHFMAQAAHETDGFRCLKEMWGPTPAQLNYEGNKALGNTQPGDGFRFRGRGVFQITGRDNYARYGSRLGLDLVNHPEIAEQPDAAIQIACLYWQDLNLNQFADRDDGRSVGNGINRGNPASARMPIGYADRQAQLVKAKAILC